MQKKAWTVIKIKYGDDFMKTLGKIMFAFVVAALAVMALDLGGEIFSTKMKKYYKAN